MQNNKNVIYGTFGLKGQECIQCVMDALEVGYRCFDTAQYYDNSSEIGKAINKSSIQRNDIFLIHKLWENAFQYDKAKDTVYSLIDKMQVDYLDAVLIHWPHPLYDYFETLEALTRLKDEGVIKHLGVSNFNREQLLSIKDTYNIEFIENEIHPYYCDKNVINLANTSNINVLAYSPTAQGKVFSDLDICKIAKEKECSVISLLFSAYQKYNIRPIVYTRKKNHMNENLRFDIVELDDEDIQRIDKSYNNMKLIKRTYMKID